MLKGKKILIGITGSIAAYKIPLLVRLLKKAGAEVRIIMTPFAKEFVTPLTLSTLSGQPVVSDFFNRENGEWQSHVELGLWADLFLIAPLTANSLAKMRMGIADNYLLTVYLSARCPVVFAPAMDLDMFKHPTTQENIKVLEKRGNLLIAPATGELASGLCGEGRMEEPETIFQFLVEFFRKQQRFAGKTILVSAGPTHESIDPVRFIGNHSTGLMGIEIARAFAIEGAMVDLVIGPTDLQVNHENIRIFPVTTAQEMHDQCIALFQLAQITVMTAAVADYRPKSKAVGKMKKTQESLHIELEPTTDILHEMGSRKKDNQILVGFALETDNELNNAKEKLKRKNLDLVVMNSLKDEGAGFRHHTNKVSLIDAKGKVTHYDQKPKSQVASDILDYIYTILHTSDVNS